MITHSDVAMTTIYDQNDRQIKKSDRCRYFKNKFTLTLIKSIFSSFVSTNKILIHM